MAETEQEFPAQQQERPGQEGEMAPEPDDEDCVAPGPVWSPLIPATFPKDKVEQFGQQVPMGRAAQPDEIAPSYVFFAAGTLSSYYTGEVLAPIGGETLPG
jgi:Enoyl-(Acyl carrier protein) reductase